MSPNPSRRLIPIVAAVVSNDRGETLLVRKRGTSAFMQPGGKRAAGETDLEALGREIEEELGCSLDTQSVRPLGRFRAMAANEPGDIVEADLYGVYLVGAPAPQGEIADILWLDPAAHETPPLAPLTAWCVLPLLRQADRPAWRHRALFICKGNWFRSQMAAAIYNRLTGSTCGESAGTYAGAPDEPEGQLLVDLFPTPHFFEAMERRGMHVRANATRGLRPDMLAGFDTIVCMAEEPNVPDFIRATPGVIWWDVENPKVVDEAKAEEIYAQMDDLVRALVAEVDVRAHSTPRA